MTILAVFIALRNAKVCVGALYNDLASLQTFGSIAVYPNFSSEQTEGQASEVICLRALR